MKRYFYDSPAIVAKWLQKNALAKSFEDEIFRSAYLTAIKIQPTENLKQLHERILNMTIAEQVKYANNGHIQCLFKQFDRLHKYSRGKEMIVDGSKCSTSTALVDPDNFPIWDLKKYAPLYQSLWNQHVGKLRYDLGFQIIVRDSRVEHFAGGRGAFLVLPLHKKHIQIGQFLGLVPGRLFQNYNDFKAVSLKDQTKYSKRPQHIHFPTGKILELTDLPILKTEDGLDLKEEDEGKVDATYHNPYALGHMINHPPPGIESNVCFNEMTLERRYFPTYLKRFLPYQDMTQDKKNINMIGIFATKEIEDKEELFVNYNEGHIYPIDDIPEWLVEPVKFSPILHYLTKQEYEIPELTFWKTMEEKAMKKNKELYEKYLKKTTYKPDKVEFEDSRGIVRKLKMRLREENPYED